MVFVYVIFGMILGWALGFFGFYFQYKHTKTIEALRKTLRDTKHDLEEKTVLSDDLEKENAIIKTYLADLKEKNSELMSVVSDLSIYVTNIKKANDEVKILSKLLSVFDEGIEERIDHVKMYDGENIEEVDVDDHVDLKHVHHH